MQFRKLKSLKFLYEINEMGVLRNVKSKKIIKGYIEKNGYVRVKIENKCLGNVIRTTIHRLVAEAFLPNPNNLPEVNHINSVRHDNRVTNLEWCTHSENMKHSYKKGFTIPPKYSKKVLLIDENKVFDSLTALANYYYNKGKGKSIQSNITYISSVLRGERPFVFGNKVKYYNS